MNVVIAVMCGGAVVLGAHIDPHGTAEAHVDQGVGGVWQGTERLVPLPHCFTATATCDSHSLPPPHPLL